MLKLTALENQKNLNSSDVMSQMRVGGWGVPAITCHKAAVCCIPSKACHKEAAARPFNTLGM